MPHWLGKGRRVTLPTQNDERKSHFSTSQTLEAVAVVAWFTGLTALMTFPLVAHLGDSLPSDLGDPLLNT